MSSYQEIKLLHRGPNSLTYLIRKKKLMVLKKIPLAFLSLFEINKLYQESVILANIYHPNIIRYLGTFQEPEHICIMTEYTCGGTLEQEMIRHQKSQQYFSEKILWKWLYQLCDATAYLHSRQIIHRDIKLSNLMLDKARNLKLIDFGSAKILSSSQNCTNTVVGTPQYLSPEMCQKKTYNHSTDIWNIGICLHALMTLQYPFRGNNIGSLVLCIMKKQIVINTRYSKDLENILRGTLQRNNEERIDLETIMLTCKAGKRMKCSSEKATHSVTKQTQNGIAFDIMF